MSSKKVTVNANREKGAPVNGKAKSEKELFPVREVDEETVLKVIDLVIELNRDTLRELANH